MVEEPEKKFLKAIKIHRNATREDATARFHGQKYVASNSTCSQNIQAVLSPSASQIKHILSSADYPLGVVSKREYFRNTEVVLYNRYLALYEMGLTDKDIKRLDDKFWLSKRGIPWSLELEDELQTFLLVKAEEKRRKRKMAAMHRDVFVDDKKTFLLKSESMGTLRALDHILSVEEEREKSRRRVSSKAWAGVYFDEPALPSLTEANMSKSLGAISQFSNMTSESSFFGEDDTERSVLASAINRRKSLHKSLTVLKPVRPKGTKGEKEYHIDRRVTSEIKEYDIVINEMTSREQKRSSHRYTSRTSIAQDNLTRKSSRISSIRPSQSRLSADGSQASLSSKFSSFYDPVKRKLSDQDVKFQEKPGVSVWSKSSVKGSSWTPSATDGSGTPFISQKSSNSVDKGRTKEPSRRESLSTEVGRKRTRQVSSQAASKDELFQSEEQDEEKVPLPANETLQSEQESIKQYVLSLPPDDSTQEQARKRGKSWDFIARRSVLEPKEDIPKAIPQMYLIAKQLQNMWKTSQKKQVIEEAKNLENISLTNVSKPGRPSTWFTGHWDDALQGGPSVIKEYIKKEIRKSWEHHRSLSRESMGSKRSRTSALDDSDTSDVIFDAAKETEHAVYDSKMAAFWGKLNGRLGKSERKEAAREKKKSMKELDVLGNMGVKLASLEEAKYVPKKSLGKMEKAVEQLTQYKKLALKQMEKIGKDPKLFKSNVSSVRNKFPSGAHEQDLQRRSVSLKSEDEEEDKERDYKLSVIRTQAEIVVKTEKIKAKISEHIRRKARASMDLQLKERSEDGSLRDQILNIEKISKRGSSLKDSEKLYKIDRSSTSRSRTKDSVDYSLVSRDETQPVSFRIDKNLLPKQGDLESVSRFRKRGKSLRPAEYLEFVEDTPGSAGGGESSQEEEVIYDENLPVSRKRGKSFGQPDKFVEKESKEERFLTSRKRGKSFGPLQKFGKDDDMPSQHRRRKIAKGKADMDKDSLSTSLEENKTIGKLDKFAEEFDTSRILVRGKPSKGKPRELVSDEEKQPIPRKKVKPRNVDKDIDTEVSTKRGKISKLKASTDSKSPIRYHEVFQDSKEIEHLGKDETAMTSSRGGKPSKGRKNLQKKGAALLRKRSSDTQRQEYGSDVIDTSPKTRKSSKTKRGRKKDWAQVSGRSDTALRRGSYGEEKEGDTLSSTNSENSEGEKEDVESLPVSRERSKTFERLDIRGKGKDSSSGPKRGKVAKGKESMGEEGLPVSQQQGKSMERPEKLREEADFSSKTKRGNIAKGKLVREEEDPSVSDKMSKLVARLNQLGQDEDLPLPFRRDKMAKGKENIDEESPPDTRKLKKIARRPDAIGGEVSSTERTKKAGTVKTSIEKGKPLTAPIELERQFPRERRKANGQELDLVDDQGLSSPRFKRRQEKIRKEDNDETELEIEVSGKKGLYRAKLDANLTSTGRKKTKHESQRPLGSDRLKDEFREKRDDDMMGEEIDGVGALQPTGSHKKGRMRAFEDILERRPKKTGLDGKDRIDLSSPASSGTSGSAFSETTAETQARISEIPRPSIDSFFKTDDDLNSSEVFSNLPSSSPGSSRTSISSDSDSESRRFLPPIKANNLFTAKSRKAVRETYLKHLKETSRTTLPAVVVPRPRITLKKPFDGWDLDSTRKPPLNARLPTLVDNIPKLINLATLDEKKYNRPVSDFESNEPPKGSPRTEIKTYLEHFGIMELFQFLLYNLIMKRPDNPLDFLVEMTRSILGQMKVHYNVASVFLADQTSVERPSSDSSIKKSYIRHQSMLEKT